MSIVTFLDLVQDDEFRSFVESRIAQQTQNCSYHFPHGFPILYKYQSLSEYAVNNVVNKVLSTTRIGEFNDLFDGALHQYGTDIERKKLRKIAGSNLNILDKRRIYLRVFYSMIAL